MSHCSSHCRRVEAPLRRTGPMSRGCVARKISRSVPAADQSHGFGMVFGMEPPVERMEAGLPCRRDMPFDQAQRDACTLRRHGRQLSWIVVAGPLRAADATGSSHVNVGLSVGAYTSATPVQVLRRHLPHHSMTSDKSNTHYSLLSLGGPYGAEPTAQPLLSGVPPVEGLRRGRLAAGSGP